MELGNLGQSESEQITTPSRLRGFQNSAVLTSPRSPGSRCSIKTGASQSDQRARAKSVTRGKSGELSISRVDYEQSLFPSLVRREKKSAR